MRMYGLVKSLKTVATRDWMYLLGLFLLADVKAGGVKLILFRVLAGFLVVERCQCLNMKSIQCLVFY